MACSLPRDVLLRPQCFEQCGYRNLCLIDLFAAVQAPWKDVWKLIDYYNKLKISYHNKPFCTNEQQDNKAPGHGVFLHIKVRICNLRLRGTPFMCSQEARHNELFHLMEDYACLSFLEWRPCKLMHRSSEDFTEALWHFKILIWEYI